MNFGTIVRVGCSLTAWVEIAALIVRLVNHYLRYRALMARMKMRKPADEKRGS